MINELLMALLGGCIGAAVALLAQRQSLSNYFYLVEHIWNNDMKQLNSRVDELMMNRMENNAVKFSSVKRETL
ncbi:hypothetical protein UFOVP855_44 [uncultured Caudovirales phage]|uniref:Uncharacterized protein n=1 Tax=uncultured Caudovirales phage TaxID=2100421 RepID=A0A6J5MPS7_9CAUD|nr:hypothetical protein UFOVP527_21 [uncultured Caudovirales phage]CAB4167726.1 hypothetical protein UFOVP855_44 [uncultured Caudovirales phage]CAB4173589.1 hypothetical protein UFOVP954_30 [uncultured Caudovirales phage]CAB4179111.1 hypothetical protein UFOVP1026_31 [uncultured Caudovirales phage]CAB4188357.1 hypothetical protein UFOVP1180_15 [uncultured Caudovirales phage]